MTAHPPLTTIGYLDRRIVIRLALAEITTIRARGNFTPLRKTPSAWESGSVEWRRKMSADRLRESLRLLRAVGFTGKRPGRDGFVIPGGVRDGVC